MITLRVPSVNLMDLPVRPRQVSADMAQQVELATLAKSQIDDPLQHLRLERANLKSTLAFATAIQWLTTNAPLKEEHVDPLAAWLENINYLAQRHILANYLQGHSRPHPALWLAAKTIHQKCPTKSYEPLKVKPEHWSLFVQAVQVQAWLILAHTKERMWHEPLDQQRMWCRSFLAGAISTLAEVYKDLAEYSSHNEPLFRYSHRMVSTTGWRQNIRIAAVLHSESLEEYLRAS